MHTAIVNLLKIQNQIKIVHWQTHSYAAHKALDKAYSDLGDLIDELVEVYQGKYGRIIFDSPVDFGLVNQEEIDLDDVLVQFVEYLSGPFETLVDSVKDTELLNIRDEILAVTNKLRYLLTLK